MPGHSIEWTRRLMALLFLMNAAVCGATSTVHLDAGTSRVELSDQLEMVADKSATLSYREAMALPGERWTSITSLKGASDFRQRVYWFRVILATASPKPLQLILEFPNGDLSRVDLYQSTEDEPARHTFTGRDLPARERPVAHRQLVLPLVLPANSENLVYVRVLASGTFQPPLTLWDDHSFYEHDRFELLEMGAYFGVLLLVLLYILIIAATLREVSLLTFAGFIASFGVFQLALFGIGAEYLWQDQPELDRLITFVSICAGLLCACWFTITTLELRQRNAPAMRFLEVMVIMTVTLSVISPFLTYEQMAPIISALTIPTSVAILSVGIIESYRGSQVARHFTLSWSLLLIGMITLALNRLGLLPNNLVTEQAAFIGFVVMVIQMSWSVASEYNRQRYEAHVREEQEARRLQDELTTQLEQSVLERTQELQEALSELSDTNAALMELSTIDSLTGIHNRYYFDEMYVKEWKRAIREKYPISLMLVDADHFKEINDTLGHLAGDNVLRHLARSIKQILRRPADILARYGGEEFVVVLPYIGNANAANLAEQIRGYVEENRAEVHGESIGLTISIGVATAQPHESIEPHDLVSAADGALYDAKNAGRNLVRNAGNLQESAAHASQV